MKPVKNEIEYGWTMKRDSNGLCNGSMQQRTLNSVNMQCNTVELISIRTGFSTDQVSSALYFLRIKGLVRLDKFPFRRFLWRKTKAK